MILLSEHVFIKEQLWLRGKVIDSDLHLIFTDTHIAGRATCRNYSRARDKGPAIRMDI